MKVFPVFILLFYFTAVSAQEIQPPPGIPAQLAISGRMILEHPQYLVRDSVNAYFMQLLEGYVGTEEGYDDPLKEVNSMLRLTDEKNKIRIYTWQIPDSTYAYKQYGLVAVATRKGIVVTRLEDQSAQVMDADFRILKPDNWFGAIYYKIIPVKKDRQIYYTLLGFSPDSKINRKIVEVLTVDKRGKPRFGAKIFKIEDFMDKKFRKAPMRLILSYGGDYAASVNWNEKEKMIIMDHLVPPEPKLKGIYRMYGPDMSYDGLVWKDDWWNLEKEVKFNSNQNIEIKPPSKPVGPPPNSSLNKVRKQQR